MGKGNGKILYPGTPTTSDGAKTVSWVDTHITEDACAYPITSSTTMGHGYQRAVSNGKKNLWRDALTFLELESFMALQQAMKDLPPLACRSTILPQVKVWLRMSPDQARGEEVNNLTDVFRWRFCCMKC